RPCPAPSHGSVLDAPCGGEPEICRCPRAAALSLGLRAARPQSGARGPDPGSGRAPQQRAREGGMTERPFAGQHAVVTGGGTGIGAAIAGHLAARGARVTLMARNLDRLRARAAELPEAQAIAVDVTDEARVREAFAQATASFGPVNILVNNAGAAEATPFHRLDPAQWRRTLEINLTGTYLCIREVVGPMRDAGYGRIINVASTAGLVGYPYVVHYTAAKHGVVG